MTAAINDNGGIVRSNLLLCNGFSFFLSWCFSFFGRQAATQRLPTMMTMEVSLGATSCCTTVAPFAFSWWFLLFLQAGKQLNDCQQQ